MMETRVCLSLKPALSVGFSIIVIAPPAPLRGFGFWKKRLQSCEVKPNAHARISNLPLQNLCPQDNSAIFFLKL